MNSMRLRQWHSYALAGIIILMVRLSWQKLLMPYQLLAQLAERSNEQRLKLSSRKLFLNPSSLYLTKFSHKAFLKNYRSSYLFFQFKGFVLIRQLNCLGPP
jgi:hypothetical protein